MVRRKASRDGVNTLQAAEDACQFAVNQAARAATAACIAAQHRVADGNVATPSRGHPPDGSGPPRTGLWGCHCRLQVPCKKALLVGREAAQHAGP